MSDYRFRAGEKGELVLQVAEYVSEPMRHGFYDAIDTKQQWRDATIADIPVRDPFASDPPLPRVVEGVGQ